MELPIIIATYMYVNYVALRDVR